MRWSRPTLRRPASVRLALTLALLLGAGFAASLPAEETVLDKLQDAVQRDDFRAIKKLIEILPNDVIGAFFSAAEAHLEAERTGDSERSALYAEVMVKVGNGFYVTNDNPDLERYAQFIKSLRAVNGQAWLDGWQAYRKYKEASVAAWENPDLEAFTAAIELAGPVLPYFERIHDYYLLGWICQDLGRFYSQKHSNQEAKEQYEQAKEYFTAFGATGKVQETQQFLDQLAQGELRTALDLEREKAAADAERKQEEIEKPLWKTVALSYRPAERISFRTPNPLATDRTVLWSGNRIEEGKFGPFYDATEFEASTFMSFYANDAIGIRPRNYSPVARYQFMHENKKIYLDYNDDGIVQKTERVTMGGRPGFQEFKLETEDGEEFRYAVNICELQEEQFFQFKSRFGEGNLRWQRACFMQGELEDGTRVILIDDDNNGTYSDWGADAILIGSGNEARFLSDIVEIGGELFRIKVEKPLGTELQVMPLQDAALGNVAVTYKGKVTPDSLYIVGAEKTNKTTVIPLELKKPVRVPVGRYVFYFGMIDDGRGKTCEMRTGQSQPFDVGEGETYTIELGAPFTFGYKLDTQADVVRLKGSDLNVYGSSKELYTRFYPEVPRGEINVKASRGGIVAKEKLKPIDQAIFESNNFLSWFPRDISWPRLGKDIEYSVRIRGKHGLLGPISCDFE